MERYTLTLSFPYKKNDEPWSGTIEVTEDKQEKYPLLVEAIGSNRGYSLVNPRLLSSTNSILNE